MGIPNSVDLSIDESLLSNLREQHSYINIDISLETTQSSKRYGAISTQSIQTSTNISKILLRIMAFYRYSRW